MVHLATSSIPNRGTSAWLLVVLGGGPRVAVWAISAERRGGLLSATIRSVRIPYAPPASRPSCRCSGRVGCDPPLGLRPRLRRSALVDHHGRGPVRFVHRPDER